MISWAEPTWVSQTKSTFCVNIVFFVKENCKIVRILIQGIHVGSWLSNSMVKRPVFVIVSHYHLSLNIESMSQVYPREPLTRLHSEGRLVTLPANIRPGCKWLRVTNSRLLYYGISNNNKEFYYWSEFKNSFKFKSN